MRFRAKVLNSAACVEFMDVDAGDASEAERVLAASGARVLELRVQRQGWRGWRRSVRFDLAVFNQQLFALLDAGQPIVDTIDVLARKDRKGRYRGVYDTLLLNLRQGKQLSEAMAALPSVFPPLYVAMVRSSETTGTVRTSISRFMAYQRQVGEIRSKIVAAAIYPAILLSVGFLVISFLMLFVLPRFSDVFAEAAARRNQEPGFVQLWGSFVQQQPLLAWGGFGLVLALALVVASDRRCKAWLGRRLLRAPLIGPAAWTLQMARMYRTLGMLLRSGVSVLTAMRMTEQTLPTAMGVSMRLARAAVAEGRPMSQSMAQAKLSTEVADRLLAAGESSGRLDEMMERIADFYDDEMRGWIDTASRVVEPALMVILGLVIGLVVLTLYSPIFDLNSAF
jgi:general secretion pathway protein F